MVRLRLRVRARARARARFRVRVDAVTHRRVPNGADIVPGVP